MPIKNLRYLLNLVNLFIFSQFMQFVSIQNSELKSPISVSYSINNKSPYSIFLE